MIDTGYVDSASSVIQYLNNLGVKKLDFILITHNHRDHIGGGIKIIDNFSTEKVYIKEYLGKDNSSSTLTDGYNKFINAVKTKGITIESIENMAGKTFDMDKMNIRLFNTTQRMNLEYYIGGSENYNSVVQFIKIGSKTTLLTSDLYSPPEVDNLLDWIATRVGKVNVLKVPHHGSNACGIKTTNLEILDPDYLIVTSVESWAKTRCLTRFNANIPRWFVNDHQAVIVDYTAAFENDAGKITITTVK